MVLLRREGVKVSDAASRNSHLSSPVTITAFPVEILLEIFDFCRVASMKWEWPYRDPRPWPGGWPGTWRRLIHVCQRWRYVVLSSPLRLDLYLDCSNSSPVKELLDVWPPFPIQVTSWNFGDNTIAALEHRDRVSQIRLGLTCLLCERLPTVIQEPLPALTSLDVWRVHGTGYESMPPLPATFLGGSAPRLQSLSLRGVPFPTLPQFLMSCNDLSELTLQNIYNLYSISAEAMVTCLSALTRLTYLCIRSDGEFLRDNIFQYPPLFTPTVTAVLPTLKDFRFSGTAEDLEDLLARIDIPQLEDIRIILARQDVFDIRQVVSHSRTLGSFNRAEVLFHNHFSVIIQLYQPEGTNPIKTFQLEIQDKYRLGWKVSSMARIGTQISDLLSGVTEFEIFSNPLLSSYHIFTNKSQWLELFHPFSAVRTLRLPGEEGSPVASSLQELTGESITEVLPNLQNLYLRSRLGGNELVQQPMGLFFTPSDHPVTLQRKQGILPTCECRRCGKRTRRARKRGKGG